MASNDEYSSGPKTPLSPKDPVSSEVTNPVRHAPVAYAFSSSPTVTYEKLNSKNYLAWSSSIELWFLGQGLSDHLEKSISDIPQIERSQWERFDYQLSQKLASLHQNSHDMTSFVAQAQAAVEELKMFLQADSHQGLLEKLENLYVVLVLRAMHPDFNHIRDQLLTSHKVPTMDYLTTRLLRVPNSTTSDPRPNIIDTSASALVTNSGFRGGRGGRGGRGVRGGRGGRGNRNNNLHCTYCKRSGHTQETCYSLHGFPDKSVNLTQSEPGVEEGTRFNRSGEQSFSLTEKEFQEFLQLKAAKPTQSSTTTVAHSGASDHVAGNQSLFSSLSSPTCPRFVTLADGSKDRGTGKTIGIGHESQGLYYLQSTSHMACATVESPSLLHHRLGHPSLLKLKKWSQECSEVFPIFQIFCSEIHNQFGKTIKVLRSDNAKEYFSADFSLFMSSHGILHQSSCPHTPQQNGVAERKNRHLIETTCTLLLDAHMPLQFWGDAVLTACYLINRMPSSAINHQVPIQVLDPRIPLYTVPPRVFGCTCFVHDLSPGRDKLSPRAIKCVFLGYSRLQKRYQCYSPITHRQYISASVTFFEDTPYFTSTTDPIVISEALPVPYFGALPLSSLQVPTSTQPDHEEPIVSLPDHDQLDPPQQQFITYQRSSKAAIPTTEVVTEDPYTSCPIPTTFPTTNLPSSTAPASTPGKSVSDSPIAIRRSSRTTRNSHPIYNFLSFHRLSPSYYAFVSSVSSV
ncbi:uncharacterized protein LOC133288188 [Gastrolobium bilobum]|uniref:uncharacterized protein LOC133288188 n=1 Tax=Gastrolobium bilobum TaxID=150636 RepID=UPI002AB29DC7|nr:uncharacterized protein LOC133288188 [Gastrolobium bilobum]